MHDGRTLDCLSHGAVDPTEDHVDLILLDQLGGLFCPHAVRRFAVLEIQLELLPEQTAVCIDVVDHHPGDVRIGDPHERERAGLVRYDADLDAAGWLCSCCHDSPPFSIEMTTEPNSRSVRSGDVFRGRAALVGVLPGEACSYASYRPPSSAAWGLPLCPASCKIGGTSGSETKLCQPSAFQSKSTQTRSSSLGSRKTVAPFDPCCFRFSAPLVEKIFSKRSKSSTCVVARIIFFSS